MTTTNCVCVKVACIRPKYDNLKEWCDDTENNVYIGRKGIVFIQKGDKKERYPKLDSPFHNPFKIGKDGNREEVLEKYRTYLINKLKNNDDFVIEFMKLKGKKLGCWCKPEPCHGDIIIEILKKCENYIGK